jgi:hypothetical protein
VNREALDDLKEQIPLMGVLLYRARVKMERFLEHTDSRDDNELLDAAVPAASAVWWRAELRRRLALEERATRPMRIAEGFACALCMVAAVLLAGQLGALQIFIR